MRSDPLTPREYLAELKAHGLPPLWERVKVGPSELVGLRGILSGWGVDSAAVDEILKGQALENYDHAESLFADLVTVFPKETSDILRDDRVLAVGTIGTLEANAKSLRAPNGGWVIAVNDGLITFLYKVARAICTRFVARDSSGATPLGESPPDFAVTCHWLASTFDWYAETGVPYGPDFPIHPAQAVIANRVAMRAEQFAICHEFAHHALGHVSNAETRDIVVAGTTATALSETRQQEFEADSFGLNFLLRSARNDEDTPIMYLAAEFFLRTVSLLDEIAERGHPREPGTHPPAETRLEKLRDHAGSMCLDEESRQALFGPAEVLATLYARLQQFLIGDSPESVEEARVRAGRCLAELNDLLDRFSHSEPPDYYNFYSGVSRMINELRFRDVIDALARAFEECDHVLRLQDWNVVPLEVGQIVKKAKLLLGFLTRNPDLAMCIESRLGRWIL